MILREALAGATRRLARAGIEGAARDARALLAEASGMDPSRVTLEGDSPLQDPALFDSLVDRRIAGEPVSKILGRRHFWGRDFEVTRDTLDPRPETETLIAAALNIGPVARLADLGTGTGIIAISMLAEWPGASAVATDVSAEALEVATRNAARHGVHDRLTLQPIGDKDQWLPPDIGRFGMILSNPPYITADEMQLLSREVHDHDPHLALSPGGDGLSPYRAISAIARDHLEPGGHLLVEIGWKQGPDVAAMFDEAGFADVQVLPDLDGRDRVVRGRNP